MTKPIEGKEGYSDKTRQFPTGQYDDLVNGFTQALCVLSTLDSGKAVWRIR